MNFLKMIMIFLFLFMLVSSSISCKLSACNPTIVDTPESGKITLLREIEIITIDTGVTYYATFQSHNQKVVSNKYGIFMTYLCSREVSPEDYNTWRLLRSIDGGKTFTKIYEGTHNTKAPVLETDSNGVIYLAHPHYVDGNVYFYRFTPEKDFKNPDITVIHRAASGKYSMFLDEKRRQIYYFSQNNIFCIISMNGECKTKYLLTAPGSHAYIMYPQLYLDRNGDLYAAWTTQKNDEYMYWSIGFICSKDGGQSWQKPDRQPLTVPVVTDESGSAELVTLDDEFNVHTWLWSMLVKNGKGYFAYLAQFKPQNRQHCVRYDLSSGKKDLDIYPEWKGETTSLASLDGFFATCSSEPGFPIYAVSKSRNNRLSVIVSYDNGQTWKDFAKSSINTDVLYSIGGAREVTSDGYIIGIYTHQAANKSDSAVRFFKVKVR
ncbi:MAG: hypothetical protein ABIH42_01355 [Planctomycetota bacterium]